MVKWLQLCYGAPVKGETMRIEIIAAVALVAGCGPSPEWRDALARRDAAYNASPQGAADEACKTKVQFAMAGHHSRTFLDLEGTAKANQLHASCLEYWRRTGQMP